MDGYIKKSDLKAYLMRRGFYRAIVKKALEEIPCADVVEVVRCRDCIHCEEISPDDGKHPYLCHLHPVFPDGDDWCKDGTKKGNEDGKL